MVQLRSARRPPLAYRALLAALGGLGTACGGDPDPAANLPAIAPDHVSAVPFRPVPIATPSAWEGIEPLHVLRTQPERLARRGPWLYAATPRGVYVFDTREPVAAPRAILLDAVPHALHIDGDRLLVLASALPGDPALVERGIDARLYDFEIDIEPGRPALVSTRQWDGWPYYARFDVGRQIVVNAAHPPPDCQPGVGLSPNGSGPGHLVIEDRISYTGFGDDRVVEASGFVETENGFVLARDGSLGARAQLTVFDISPTTVTSRAPLTVDAESLPPAAMGVAGRALAFFAEGPSGMQLRVFDSNTAPFSPATAPVLASLDVAVPPAIDDWDGIRAARFAGRFVLVPWATLNPPSTQNGVIIDWQAEAGPAVTAELPGDLPRVQQLDDRWLGWGPTRSVLFRIGAMGSFDIELELGSPGDESLRAEPYWDPATQRVVLARRAGLPDADGSQRPELATLDLSRPAPSWVSGPRTFGRPLVGDGSTSSDGTGQALQLSSGDTGRYALTTTYVAPRLHWLVEKAETVETVDGAPENLIYGFEAQTLATAHTALGSAELLESALGTRRVRLAEGTTGAPVELPLGYGAEQLLPFGDGFVSYSTTPGPSCLWNGAEPNDLSCYPSDVPALSQLALDPPRVVSDTPLPGPDAAARQAGAPFPTWSEAVVQNDQVALLERRDDAGATQVWLHPFDAPNGSFQEAVQLGDVDPVGSFGATGLHVDGGVALVRLMPVEVSQDDGLPLTARVELWRAQSLDARGADGSRRIAVRGLPWSVSGDSVVSIEPVRATSESDTSHVLVHHMLVRDGQARLAQTLELEGGHIGQLWANTRGYVARVTDDRCTAPITSIDVLSLASGQLEVIASASLPGALWQITHATDERVLLRRRVDGLSQYALLEVGPVSLTLLGYETRVNERALDLVGNDVHFAQD